MEAQEVTWDEAVATGLADHEQMLRRVRRVGRAIVFEDGSYEVDLDLCRRHEDILAWVMQLCDKSWITPPMIRRFVLLATEASDLPRPRL